MVSFLIGQHYAVQSLWNAADPNAFAHRTSFGIVPVVAFGFLAVGGHRAGPAEPGRLALLTVAGALTYPFYLVHEHLGWVAVRALHRSLGIPSSATFAADDRLDAGAGLAAEPARRKATDPTTAQRPATLTRASFRVFSADLTADRTTPR
ncbi:hypothetical protein STENM223S_03258 [Streptomyces tendae]